MSLPEKKGYDFTGWYLDKSLTQFAGTYRDSYRITKDTDFYAKWEKTGEEDKKGDNTDDSMDQGNSAEVVDTYTVRYDANGGTVKESSAKVAKGAGIKLPAAEREGFAFKGWYTGRKEFIGKAGGTYKPDQDICLYAGWDKSDGENAEDINSSSDTKTVVTVADTGSGVSADKKLDIPTVGKSGNTAAGVPEVGTENDPVIQTGRTSPIYLLAVLGMAGIFLAAFSVREGKRSSGE